MTFYAHVKIENKVFDHQGPPCCLFALGQKGPAYYVASDHQVIFKLSFNLKGQNGQKHQKVVPKMVPTK